jgi:ribokinase
MNETEAIHYGRKSTAREAILDFSAYCSLVVAKLGKQGSMAVDHGVIKMASPYPVTAVDTTGAGDSFNAGFICGYLEGLPVEECLQYANGCGALSVTAYGGNTAFPTREELIAFLSANKK